MRRIRQVGWVSAATIMIGAVFAIARTALAQAAADESPAKLQQIFLEASHAFDAGQPAEAASLYGQLVSQGYGGPELFFNLGNAYFKSGKIGDAVLNYRRAWRSTPRDPDIQANLRFALQSTGAIDPAYPSWAKALLRYSLSEWALAAVAAYWGCSLIVALIIVFRPWRPLLWRALALGTIALAVSLAGIGFWLSLSRHPEVVITQGGQQALFAPIDKSTAFFAVPEGSIVRVQEESGAWLKVASGKQSGWLHSAVCTPVYPWTNRDKTYN